MHLKPTQLAAVMLFIKRPLSLSVFSQYNGNTEKTTQ